MTEKATWYVVTSDGDPEYVAKDESNARRWMSHRSMQRAYDLNGHPVRYEIVPVVRAAEGSRV